MRYSMRHSSDDNFDTITLSGSRGGPKQGVDVPASTSFFFNSPLSSLKINVLICSVCVYDRDVLSSQQGTVPLKLARGFHGDPVHSVLAWLLISPHDENSRRIK